VYNAEKASNGGNGSSNRGIVNTILPLLSVPYPHSWMSGDQFDGEIDDFVYFSALEQATDALRVQIGERRP